MTDSQIPTICLSERPLIRLAVLGTFPPRGEGSVGALASWPHRRFVVLLLPIAWWGPLKTHNFEKNMEEKLRIFKGFS